MTIKEFVEKSIEGGWKTNWYIKPLERNSRYTGVFGNNDELLTLDEEFASAFLDPKAWEAVGKVEGWNEKVCNLCGEKQPYTIGNDGKKYYCDFRYRYVCHCPKFEPKLIEWKYKMHQMIDHLIDGGTIESYIKTL